MFWVCPKTTLHWKNQKEAVARLYQSWYSCNMNQLALQRFMLNIIIYGNTPWTSHTVPLTSTQHASSGWWTPLGDRPWLQQWCSGWFNLFRTKTTLLGQSDVEYRPSHWHRTSRLHQDSIPEWSKSSKPKHWTKTSKQKHQTCMELSYFHELSHCWSQAAINIAFGLRVARSDRWKHWNTTETRWTGLPADPTAAGLGRVGMDTIPESLINKDNKVFTDIKKQTRFSA